MSHGTAAGSPRAASAGAPPGGRRRRRRCRRPCTCARGAAAARCLGVGGQERQGEVWCVRVWRGGGSRSNTRRHAGGLELLVRDAPCSALHMKWERTGGPCRMFWPPMVTSHTHTTHPPSIANHPTAARQSKTPPPQDQPPKVKPQSTPPDGHLPGSAMSPSMA